MAKRIGPYRAQWLYRRLYDQFRKGRVSPQEVLPRLQSIPAEHLKDEEVVQAINGMIASATATVAGNALQAVLGNEFRQLGAHIEHLMDPHAYTAFKAGMGALVAGVAAARRYKGKGAPYDDVVGVVANLPLKGEGKTRILRAVLGALPSVARNAFDVYKYEHDFLRSVAEHTPWRAEERMRYTAGMPLAYGLSALALWVLNSKFKTSTAIERSHQKMLAEAEARRIYGELWEQHGQKIEERGWERTVRKDVETSLNQLKVPGPLKKKVVRAMIDQAFLNLTARALSV